MSKKEIDTKTKKRGLSRRDFLKISAAGAGAMALDWTLVGPSAAVAAEYVITDTSKRTTCPYCSVGCNLVVALGQDKGPDGNGTGPVKAVDIYGDPDCPINKGKLCSKGAAAIQLANNKRRVGVPDSIHVASRSDGTDDMGPMKRTGNNEWTPISWTQAIDDIATAMVAAREAVPVENGKVTGQTKGVAFLGCSHATNEENWIYRKLIANFGTNNTEHQARI
ncbi:MAG TPA: twin-arginine translocation signal domain-containing protein [Candidatus Aquicultor sp.]|jgi:formate dehydrogenase major subunit